MYCSLSVMLTPNTSNSFHVNSFLSWPFRASESSVFLYSVPMGGFLLPVSYHFKPTFFTFSPTSLNIAFRNNKLSRNLDFVLDFCIPASILFFKDCNRFRDSLTYLYSSEFFSPSFSSPNFSLNFLKKSIIFKILSDLVILSTEFV